MKSTFINIESIDKPMEIIFADLTHTGHPCRSVPYGISLVAAYALEMIGAEISTLLIKEPSELTLQLERREPRIVCFSTYIWNSEISFAYARRIKARYKKCIIVFGGPNYPVSADEQLTHMRSHPEIDFFVCREGETVFVELYNALKGHNFNAAELKEHGASIPGCHFFWNDRVTSLPPLSMAEPLDKIPSPYLIGLCDPFLEQGYAAIIQAVRGCPFRCTYCQEGDEYFNSVKRYSNDRVKDELWYLGARAKAQTLYVADSNFGMYLEDLEIAEELANVQNEHGWPNFVSCISGKNNKALVLKTAAIIKGGQLNAAIQSSDAEVLRNINRQNVSIKEVIEITTEQILDDTHSFSEIILALPGDTVSAHMKSATDLIDAGIHVVRSHQLIILPGAELATAESRSRFGLQTRFRVMHNTANVYSVFGQSFHAPEIDEICTANVTMSFQDYLDCRCFDLTLEIFYNNGLFSELHTFLKQLGISISAFIKYLHSRVYEKPQLEKLYAGFLEETQELWTTRKDLDLFLRQPGVIERYVKGELGRNEQLAYKAKAIFELMEDLMALAYSVAGDVCQKAGYLTPDVSDYLNELKRFDLLSKTDLLSADDLRSALFHYDFCALRECDFKSLPWDYRLPVEASFVFSHNSEYRSFVKKMRILLDAGLCDYATVISTNTKIRDYFRSVARGDASRSSD